MRSPLLLSSIVLFLGCGALAADNPESELDQCLSTHQQEFPGLSIENLRSLAARLIWEAPKVWVRNGEEQECIAYGEPIKAGEKLKVLKHLPPTECGHQWVSLTDTGTVKEQGKFLFHPLSRFTEKDLVPEIMALNSGQTVPPAIYRKYGSRQIAITLIYKKHLDQEASAEKPAYDYLDDSRVQMMFNHKVLDSIAEKGFLNQHQFKPPPGPGVYAPLARANSEDRLVGFTLAEKNENGDTSDAAVNAVLNEVRPKYSFLDLSRLDPDKHPLARSPRSSFDVMYYGNVLAVFNPDVNDRTTFTMSDSLHEKSARTLRVASNSDFSEESGVFVEGQVWGKLGISDVHHFIVNCPKPYPPLSDEEIKKLKSLGKPVYECKQLKARRPANVRAWDKDRDGPLNWDDHWQEKVVRYSEGREL